MNGDCSHEIKICLILGNELMANLDSVLESRDTTFLAKVCTIKVMVFLVVMYRYENWNIKKTEC